MPGRQGTRPGAGWTIVAVLVVILLIIAAVA